MGIFILIKKLRYVQYSLLAVGLAALVLYTPKHYQCELTATPSTVAQFFNRNLHTILSFLSSVVDDSSLRHVKPIVSTITSSLTIIAEAIPPFKDDSTMLPLDTSVKRTKLCSMTHRYHYSIDTRENNDIHRKGGKQTSTGDENDEGDTTHNIN